MKKILFVTSNSYSPDPRASKQMKTLSSKGYTVTAVGWDRETKENQDFTKENITYHLIGIRSSYGSGMKNLVPLFLYQVKLFFYLLRNKKNYEIIQSANFDTAIISFIISKILKKILIYDIYDYYVDTFPVPKVLKKTVRKLDNFIINNSYAVILPLEERIEQIKPARAKKLLVLYNTPEYLSFGETEENEKFVISFVGAIHEERFISEILEIVSEDDDLLLNIAGFGNEELVEKIKNSKNTVYFGKVNHDEGLNISNSSDLMLCMYDPDNPNHKYSAPNKFYEAMMLGKPILVAKGMGIDRYVLKYDTGIISEYNVLETKNSIDLIKNKKEELKVIGNKATDIYFSEFSWEIMEKRLLDLYQNI